MLVSTHIIKIFQIEFLINEFFKKTNENILNLIHHEYIQVSFLFNKHFMQRSFYIFMIKKNWIVKHAIEYDLMFFVGIFYATQMAVVHNKM